MYKYICLLILLVLLVGCIKHPCVEWNRQHPPKFKLGEVVRIKVDNRRAVIVPRVIYPFVPPYNDIYTVEYVDGDGKYKTRTYGECELIKDVTK